jgi:putative integral membrane protein (TIGR02587 family)
VQSETKKTAVAYSRGVVGGMIVGVPVLMTMEVWEQAFVVPAWRLLLLYAFNYGVLLILQHFSGLHHKKTPLAQARAALVAYGIGIIASTIVMLLMRVISAETNLRDLAGKLILESIPVSIGSSVAMSEFGDDSDVAERRREGVGYWGSMGMALAGAALFGFGVSATEEETRVGAQLDWWHALLLVLVSIGQVVAIVYAVGFRSKRDHKRTPVRTVVTEAVSTYAVAILAAAYFLWTFGTIGPGMSLIGMVYILCIAGFITSLGAAAGELLL